MSDEGELQREKAVQRPSKSVETMRMDYRCLAYFRSRLQCLHGSFSYESRGWSCFSLQGLGGSLLVDVLVDRSDAR
jgi:hypothetical protein